MSRYFINHPVFAWVIAIMIVISGVLAILGLGVESYPNIAPPQVGVNAIYPGANAETVERAVTQVIEQQLTGIDNLDLLQRLVGFRRQRLDHPDVRAGHRPGHRAGAGAEQGVAGARRACPSEVIQQGVMVAKANSRLPDGRGAEVRATGDRTATRCPTSSARNVLDQIARVPGVGSTQLFGGQYAMNIWLNPDKLHGYGLSATQVLAAVRGQNVQFAAGQIGGEPSPRDAGLHRARFRRKAASRTPEQFEQDHPAHQQPTAPPCA